MYMQTNPELDCIQNCKVICYALKTGRVRIVLKDICSLSIINSSSSKRGEDTSNDKK